MKLSFSTNAFVRYSVVKAVEKISSIGYEGVELLADIPHLYVHAMTASDIDRVKETIAWTGVKVANVNANTVRGYYGRKLWDPIFEPSLANPDPTARKWRVDYCKKSIDLAHALGSPMVSITSGRSMPEITPERSMDLLRESLKEVIEYAEGRNIRIGMEYEQGLLIEFAGELTALLAEIDSPYFGADLDLGHSHLAGEDPEAAIRSLAGKIFHVHLEDIKARKHYHLIPGLGDIDFEALLGLLARHAYDGFLTVDLYTYPFKPEEAARRAFEYLKALPLQTRG
ncbi:MAG: sugar phosphate isomerase/epimerase [Nitrospirales bacterium]|nr:sugar phosphate isomerase/epimerase [Nitrospirales bacterium]